jgi:PAS domain S-box-containing protein
MKVVLDLPGRCGECLLFGAIQGLEDALVLVDPQGVVFHVNRRAEELLGISAARVMGTKFRACLRPPALVRFWNSAVRRSQPAVTELLWPDVGQLRATVSLCRSRAGAPIGRALLLRDISAEKQIQVSLPVAVAKRLVEMAGPDAAPGETALLTPRERQILGLLALGLSNATIAQRLHVSSNTIASHLKHLFPKIGAHNRAQAAAYALARGIRATS